MQNLILTIGKPKSEYIAAGLADYAGRMKAYGGCRLLHLRAEKGGKSTSPAQIKKAEAQRILQKLEPRDAVWALDVKGKGLGSKAWAKALDAERLAGLRRLVLIIGGAEGLDGPVLARAGRVISLGAVTLPHGLAALVAAEQLYRAHTILAGTPYHRP